MSELPKRSQVKEEFKWAIEDLFMNQEAWRKEYEQTSKLADQLIEFKGTLGLSADHLLSYLEFDDKLSIHLERVYVYANQKYHEDTSNGNSQEIKDQAEFLSTAVSSNSSFALPEILAIPIDKLKSFLAENEKLRVYETYLNHLIRSKEHTLSAEMEALLADSAEIAKAPSNIFSMFNNADIKFPEIEDENGKMVAVTHGRYQTFMQSSNQRVRRDAFLAMYSVYHGFKNTLAATFYSNVKKEMFYAKAKHYSSTIAMKLFSSNISQTVYDNLIQSVDDHLYLLHRYMAVRKRLMNLKELHLYDLYTPIVADVDKKIPFEQGKEMVLNGLKPLGQEYINILEEGYDNRWIDIYENQGKRSGAYSWGAYGTHPYVLLNYQDNFNNVFTLAHEMGHAIHSYCSDKKQPYVYAAYKIFVAEVASTCNEALLMEDLLSKTTEKRERAYLINYFLEQFRTTLYRQVMFAEFERDIHQMAERGIPLTADTLSSQYYKLNQKYFGEEVIIDEDISMEWARIPHFYTPFYVYQYATGYSAAIALSRKIIAEGKPAVDKYMEFLSSGSSDYPIELLKRAGVNMETTEPINTALEVFGELLDELEELL